MIVGVARVTFRIHFSHSLKEKRQVVKSLIAHTQNRFHMSVAEVDMLDDHQTAVIGLGYVSNDSRHADEALARAVSFLESRASDAELVGYETEIVHAL